MQAETSIFLYPYRFYSCRSDAVGPTTVYGFAAPFISCFFNFGFTGINIFSKTGYIHHISFHVSLGYQGQNIMIPGSKGHGMDACIHFHDVLTRKTRKIRWIPL